LLGHSFVHSVAGFYAAWIWLGLGMAATLYTPAFAVVTRRFGPDFRRAIITLTFLGGLASTVFIPLFAWAMDVWGWRQALWGLAALQWGVCMPLHAWLLQGAPRVPSTLGTPGTPSTSGRQVAKPVSVREHLRHAPFWLLALFMVLMMSVTSALPAHMIALLQEAGLSPAWVIAVPAAIGVIQVVGRLVLFVFERHWDVHTANRWIPGFIPLGLLALLLGGFHPLGALVFVVLFGLGNGMITIVKGTALAQYVSREHVGQLNGLLGMPIALARAAAPLAVGLLWSPTQGYRLALGGLLLASVMATAALWVAQRQALKRRH
jgi:MFS family permease